MSARTIAIVFALAGAVLVLPGAASPAPPAAANCIEIDGVDDCFNPCMEAAAVYNAAREATGTEDKTPDAHCTA